MSESGKGGITSAQALLDAWIASGQLNDRMTMEMLNEDLGPAWVRYTMTAADALCNFSQAIKDAPDKLLESKALINDDNFWLVREALRMRGLDVSYQRPECWNDIASIKPNLRFHFLHVSVDDPSMVAYTPSHAYGIADRQVRTKLGKYLMAFYGDVMSESQIKDLVSAHINIEVKWGSTREEFKHVYANGPDSCMAGSDDFDCHPIHPAEAYAAGEFRIAYIQKGDNITARSVVHEPSKTFVRLYGDDADKLMAMLKKSGYEKASAYPDGAKLLIIPYRENAHVLPYLDGNSRYVKLGNGNRCFEINSTTGMYYCDCTNGVYYDRDSANMRTCDHCGDDYDEDDVEFSEVRGGNIVCEGCLNEYFVYAYTSTGRYSRQEYIHTDNTVLCESNGEYYHAASEVLEHYNIVECPETGHWYNAEDIITTRAGEQCNCETALNVGSDANDEPMYDLLRDLTLDHFVRIGTETIFRWNQPAEERPAIIQFLAPEAKELSADPLPSEIISIADAINMGVAVYSGLDRDCGGATVRLAGLKNEMQTALAAMQNRAA